MEHIVVLTAHGSSKTESKPYIRTQKSTLTSLKESVATSQPRIAVDKVAENLGGMLNGNSSGSWPRDIKQAYNLKSRIDCKAPNIAVSSDPYMALVMQCKEEAKDEKTAYIRQVTCAPEPLVILASNEQLHDLVRFCTHDQFGVFAVDPTFDLGSFSVTTTTFENLHLISRRGGAHPVMIGPMLIHQKKEVTTYSALVDYLLKSRPKFQNLKVLGTDGELALSSPFLDKCPNLIHLLCFIHFKNNITNHLKSVGVDECSRRCILADIFGQQQGTRFEEGIVDSEDEKEFRVRLSSLQSVWVQRLGQKGLKFHQWFVKHKADLMEKKMLKPVRIRAGLGQPPRPYYTNRVECANSLLSSETGHKELPVNEFVASMRALTERQARNVRWAIINKGPYQLHPDLSHLQLLEETWLQMGEEEKESYVEMVLQSDVHLKTTQPSEKNPFQSLPLSDQPVSGVSANDGAAHGFPTPADAAFSIIDLDEEFDESRVSLGVEQAPQFDLCDGQDECSVYSSVALEEELQSISDCTTSESRRTSRQQSSSVKNAETRQPPVVRESSRNTHMMPLEDFSQFFADQPLETIKGIYEKAKVLLGKQNSIVPAPGCDPKARMVESTRFRDKPHLVTPGKKGEYRCEKNCPHYNGIRICSHSVATAQDNGELLVFLTWFSQSFSKRGMNLTSAAKTDMPKYPGRKGGKPPTSKRSATKLPVQERAKRTYAVKDTVPPATQTPNNNAFFLKKMNSRIKVCQGCRGSLKSADGTLQYAPFDYCIARQEQRPFYDRNSGQTRIPKKESAAHYHLRVECIRTEEPNFVPSSLKIPDDLELSAVHVSYLRAAFGINL